MSHQQDRGRRAARLNGYDYGRAGAYFVTVCTEGKECVFGEVVGEKMVLNEGGEEAVRAWEGLARRFPSIELDAFVVMPNHVHGIVLILYKEEGAASGAGSTPGGGERCAKTEEGAASSAPTFEGGEGMGNEGKGAVYLRPPYGGLRRICDNPPEGRRVNPPQSPPHKRGVKWRVKRRASSGPTLGDVMRVFKSVSAIGVNRRLSRKARKLWQGSYFDRVIRNEGELGRIREYIVYNRLKWGDDPENPNAVTRNARMPWEESVEGGRGELRE